MDDINQLDNATLIDVFDQLKGSDKKLNPFINFDSFKNSVLEHRPDSFKELIEKSFHNRAAAEEFEEELEQHFRNICESG